MVFREVMLTSVICVVSTLSLLPLARAHTKSELEPRPTVCLKEFPTDPSQFNDLVKPYVKKIIERHGLEEWKAVLLTNELHRHLGLWSIIGAKMGIRAREILGAPADAIDVISFAGHKPPWSCINDGLQVSTGSSLARGTISVAHLGKPLAIFTYNGIQITLKVKPEIVKTVRKVIKDLSEKYGFQSERYFRELDKISVQYWLEWDRKQIFEEVQGYM
jgi:pyrimidine-specific ribonucleoside hydrolase